jgi:hypothetical protein
MSGGSCLSPITTMQPPECPDTAICFVDKEWRTQLNMRIIAADDIDEYANNPTFDRLDSNHIEAQIPFTVDRHDLKTVNGRTFGRVVGTNHYMCVWRDRATTVRAKYGCVLTSLQVSFNAFLMLAIGITMLMILPYYVTCIVAVLVGLLAITTSTIGSYSTTSTTGSYSTRWNASETPHIEPKYFVGIELIIRKRIF